MKVFSPIGSKERLFEMLERVNKINLNENNILTNPIESLNVAFNKLVNNELETKRITNDIKLNESYTTLNCLDDDGKEITFVFKSDFTNEEMDGVVKIKSSKLIEFFIDVDDNSLTIDDSALKEFNGENKANIIDFISNYIDFEDEIQSKIGELNEAVELIDKIPYKRSTEELQKHKSYADEKPTNQNLRVNSPELNSFISEFNDIFDDEIVTDDNLSKDINNDVGKAKDLENDYDDVDMSYLDTKQNYDDVEKTTPEEDALYNQAFDNLMMKNKTNRNPNYFPTKPEVEREVERLNKLNKPPEDDLDGNDEYSSKMAKGYTRVYPAWADEFLFENDLKLIDVNTIKQKYFNLTTDEFKKFSIKMADELISHKLGDKKYQLSKDEYYDRIRKYVTILFSNYLERNEVNENDIADNIENTNNPIKDSETNEDLNIGDVVEVSGVEGIFQIGVLGREGKPFLMPFDMDTKKPYTKFRIYLMSLKDYEMKKIMSFSETNGGYIIESEDVNTINDIDVENLAKEREKIGDQIEGGLGDDKSPLEFDPQQIKLGMKVEMEHTNDPIIALEIALDHLTEDPKYYTVKDDPEVSAQVNASQEASEFNDKEMVDELLGYKPINVGDLTEDIIGSDGAKPAVGGQTSVDDGNDDELKKYQEYKNRDFNSLTDNDKEEFFSLWKKYREGK